MFRMVVVASAALMGLSASLPAVQAQERGTATGAEVQLTCRGRHAPEVLRVFLMDVTALVAREVSEFDAPAGQLEITDAAYLLHFQETERRWAIDVRINRFTGEGQVEIGTPPFFTGNVGNILVFYVCAATDPARLF